MIKCFFLKRKIFLFADGELKSRSLKKTKKHLHECSRCRKIFNTYLSLSHNISEIFSESTSFLETEGMYYPIKQEKIEKKSSPVDRIIDLIFTGTGSQTVAVSPMAKLIPAILVTLFILLFFTTPVIGEIPHC